MHFLSNTALPSAGAQKTSISRHYLYVLLQLAKAGIGLDDMPDQQQHLSKPANNKET
jgi:hypothetical protein